MNDKQFLLTMQNIQNANNENARKAAREANEFSWVSQQEAERFNAKEAAKNRAFQLDMSNTAHQREVRDLQAAGLNPILSVNNGAAVSSGAAASVGSSSGARADTDTQLAGLYAQWKMNKINNANALKINKMNNETALKTSRMAAAASMYGANAAAGAAMYSANMNNASAVYSANMNYNTQKYVSDNNLTNSREQRQYDENHPSNAWQAGSSVLNKLGLTNSYTDTGTSKGGNSKGNNKSGRGRN